MVELYKSVIYLAFTLGKDEFSKRNIVTRIFIIAKNLFKTSNTHSNQTIARDGNFLATKESLVDEQKPRWIKREILQIRLDKLAPLNSNVTCLFFHSYLTCESNFDSANKKIALMSLNKRC